MELTKPHSTKSYSETVFDIAVPVQKWLRHGGLVHSVCRSKSRKIVFGMSFNRHSEPFL